MSPLALPCLAFAAAIFAANFLPSSYMLVSSALLMVALYIFFSLKDSGKRIFVKCAAAYFAGLLCFAAHWFAYVYTAEKLDGSIMELHVLAKTDAAELSNSIRFDEFSVSYNNVVSNCRRSDLFSPISSFRTILAPPSIKYHTFFNTIR